MSHQEDDSAPPTRPQRQILSERVAKLMVDIDSVHQEFNTAGDVSQQTHKDLQRSVVTVGTYFEKMYGDDPAVDMSGIVLGDSDIKDLRSELFSSEVRNVLPDGQHSPSPEPKRVPKRIPFEALYETALELLDIAESLSLVPKARTEDRRSKAHISYEE